MKSNYYLCLLLIIGALLSSCTSSGIELTPTQIEIETLPPSPTSILPTVSPTLTPPPTLTATLTPPVTLESNYAKATISARLQEPIDCPAPCFWGITPGETTLGKAKNAFVQLGLDLELTNTEGGNKFYGEIYDLGDELKITTVLAVKDNIVKNLKVSIAASEPKSANFQEWLAYSPGTLIARYGTPSKVNFVYDWGQRSSFAMEIYFNNSNLIIRYSIYGYLEKTFPQICPLIAPIEHITLWLGKDPQNPPRDIVLLEKGTSLTLEDFAELMTRPPSKACFTLKPDAFP